MTNRFSGPANGNDEPAAVAVDAIGNVFVTGHAAGNYIFATIKYASLSSVPSPLPIPIEIQLSGGQVVLSWTNAAFSLQAAPAVQGVYTNLPGAMSPSTNSISGSQQFFRLKAN